MLSRLPIGFQVLNSLHIAQCPSLRTHLAGKMLSNTVDSRVTAYRYMQVEHLPRAKAAIRDEKHTANCCICDELLFYSLCLLRVVTSSFCSSLLFDLRSCSALSPPSLSQALCVPFVGPPRSFWCAGGTPLFPYAHVVWYLEPHHTRLESHDLNSLQLRYFHSINSSS